MINKSIAHWAYNDSMRNLAFFANLVDELTFNYTIDSFKAPTLNVISLLEECHTVIKQIHKGIIAEGAFQSVIEELTDALQTDDIFKSLVERLGICYLVEGIEKNTPTKQLENILDVIATYQLNHVYTDALKESVVELITTNSKKRDLLEKHTRLLMTQFRNEGYSDEYLYFTNRDFFYNPSITIDSFQCIEEFLSYFDCIDKDYTVYHVGDPFYIGLKNAFNIKSADVLTGLTDDGTDPQLNLFCRKTSKNSVFVKAVVRAKDVYAARMKAIELIMSVTRFFSFYYHKGAMPLRKYSLVIENATGCSICVTPPTPNIIRCKDNKRATARKLFNMVYNRVSFCEDSLFRLSKSMELHKEALEADNIENQYINLFTAIEVLIPKDPESKKDRILQIHDTIVPYLSVNYFKKLIDSTLRSLKLWNKAAINRILSKVTEGDNHIERLAALMILPKYDGNGDKSYPLDELYDLLNADHYYLMLHRMYRLHVMMKNHKSIKDFLELHEKRIKWHIDRIYRTRNMIVHAGISPRYIGTLTENLHSYYDIVTTQLIEDSIKQNFDDMQLSYTSCMLKVQSYRRYLNETNGDLSESSLFKAIFNK